MAINGTGTTNPSTPTRLMIVEKEIGDLVLSAKGRKKVKRQRDKAVAFLRDVMYIELLPGRMHLFLRARYCGTPSQFHSWETIIEYIKHEPEYSPDAEAMFKEIEEIKAYEKKYARTLMQATTLVERLSDYRNRDDQIVSTRDVQKSL